MTKHMRPTRLAAGFTFLVIVSLALSLPGCTYTSGWKSGEAARRPTVVESAVVSFTFAQRKQGTRREFFEYVRSVLDQLPAASGLLGYAFKFELLGDKAWTITAWESEQALDRFVFTGMHRKALNQSEALLAESRFTRVTLPHSELPPDWSLVMSQLHPNPEATKPTTKP